MARLPRLAVPGQLHLLTQHARPGLALFDDEADRHAFLAALRDAAMAQRVAVHAYGLLDGDVRMLVTPPDAAALSRAWQSLGRRFGAAYNRRHGRGGSLWVGRFRASPVEPDEHFLRCLRYVEADTARASSLAHHLGQRADPLLTEHAAFWRLGNTPFEREARYSLQREQALTSGECATIDAALRSGWPLGAPHFAAEVATRTGRRAVRGTPGRKPVPI